MRSEGCRPVWKRFYPEGATDITEHVFLAMIDGTQALQLSAEHDEFRRCGLEEAFELLWYSNNVEALLKCRELLKK